MANGKLWTKEQLEMLIAFYPDNTRQTLVHLTGRLESSIYSKAAELGLKKSKEYLDSPAACRLRRGDNVGKQHRFSKGNTAWNKGKKVHLPETCRATQFKKGMLPANHKPIGYIRLSVDGYLEIKVSEVGQKFKALHRVVWERMNGQIPKGMVVAFLDNDKTNVKITNLTLLNKAQNMNRNSLYNYPKEIVQLVKIQGAITRQINKKEIKA